jgi:hypothetical protein
MHFKIMANNLLHINVRPQSVGKQGGVSRSNGTRQEPVIMPKRSRATVLDFNIGKGSIGRELVFDDVPKIGCGSRRIIREDGVIVQQPILPRSIGIC